MIRVYNTPRRIVTKTKVGYNRVIEGDLLSLVMNIIIEEFHRNRIMQKEYQKKIDQLPKGTIIIKKIGNHEYHYLKYRNGKKTVTDYIGRDQKNIDKTKFQIKKRKHFEMMLLQLKEEYKLIDKLMGGKL